MGRLIPYVAPASPPVDYRSFDQGESPFVEFAVARAGFLARPEEILKVGRPIGWSQKINATLYRKTFKYEIALTLL